MKRMLTMQEIDNIKRITSKNVKVGCDKHHQHTALDNCLVGDEKDITILKLCETVLYMKGKVCELADIICKE